MWPQLALVVAIGGCAFQHGAAAAAGSGDAGPSSDARNDGPTDAVGPHPGTDAAADALAAKACPSGYSLADAARPLSHYRLVTASASWTQAETDCENDAVAGQQAAHLIVLDDISERNWAYGTTTSDQWAGVSDRILEDTFLAVTAQFPYYVNPNNNTNANDCVIIKQDDTYTDSCNGGHPYLCECDGFAADPLRF